MSISEVDKAKCTGCSACANCCPQQCIQMKENAEGYLVPVVQWERCIDCNVCETVCPIDKPRMSMTDAAVYAAFHRDETVRTKSSSGGIFYELSKKVLEDGGIVFGAGFTPSFRVKHRRCDTLQDLPQIMGSKYVQSEIGSVFQEVKRDLEDGKTVLFSGVPCQVQGLLNYLKKPYAHLITVDLFCHGVPSPKAWEKYLDFQRKTYQSEIQNISFRNKETGWRNYSVRIEFENGEVYSRPFGEDRYMLSFLLNCNLRESCARCSYRGLSRNSDITLGDFWASDALMPEMDDDKGVSLVVLRTDNAYTLWNAVKDSFKTAALDSSIVDQVKCACSHTVALSAKRAAFFQYLSQCDFGDAYDRVMKTSFWELCLHLPKRIVCKVRSSFTRFH